MLKSTFVYVVDVTRSESPGPAAPIASVRTVAAFAAVMYG
jgi:hypothetical protein